MLRPFARTLPALLLMAAACARPADPAARTRAEDAIRTADEAWARAFGARNLDESVGFVAASGSVLAPNAPIATGSEAVRQLFAGFFALPALAISWHPTSVRAAASGELGYSTGTYQMSFNDPAGKPVTDHGKYVTVWEKQQDGGWKVILDIFNSDLTAGASAP